MPNNSSALLGLNVLTRALAGKAGGSTHLMLWDAASQSSGPPAGFVRGNNVSQKDSTIIYMSGISSDGTVIQKEIFEKHLPGTLMSIDAAEVGDQYSHFQIVSRVLNGADVDFTVAPKADEGGNLATNQKIGVTFDIKADPTGFVENPMVVDLELANFLLKTLLDNGLVKVMGGDGIDYTGNGEF